MERKKDQTRLLSFGRVLFFILFFQGFFSKRERKDSSLSTQNIRPVAKKCGYIHRRPARTATRSGSFCAKRDHKYINKYTDFPF